MTTTKFNLRPCTWVWLILMVLTLAVLAIGQAGLSGITIVALLLVSTLVKTHMVADYFMGLKHGQPLWRIIMIVYLWIIVTMIGLAYWIGMT
jgi:cytochrome c oxidase subunit IV